MEETIYVVEENEDEEEVVRVSKATSTYADHDQLAKQLFLADYSQEIRDALCPRYVLFCDCVVIPVLIDGFVTGDSVVLISPQAPL